MREDDGLAAIEDAQARGVEKAAPTQELGVSGLKVYGGLISQNEEFLRQLQGPRGVRAFREMSDNDSTIGALLTAIELMLRPVDWNVEAADQSSEALEKAEFVKSLLDDMSHTFGDFIAEMLTMLTFGWSYFEIVYKLRVGPEESTPERRSKYTDGRVGWRKLAPRAQETLSKWLMQEDGGIDGMQQQHPQTGKLIDLPIDKSLLFRTTSRKNNPEGRSILRTAYRAWFLLKTAQDYEGVGIERELAGLPVVYIPNATLIGSDPGQQAAKLAYEKMARDLKFNEQGGVVLPSDPFLDKDGNPTNIRKVELKLLSTGGNRAIDTNAVVVRYQRDIARSALADFLMLGTDGRGSYALSTDKTELFLRACETYLQQCADVLNRHALPRVWRFNGFPFELMPKLTPGRVAPKDVEKLGAFLERLARTGMPLFPDPTLEAFVRGEGGLPEEGAVSVGGREGGESGGTPEPGATEQT